MRQYKNVKADVCPPVSASLLNHFFTQYLGAIWNVVSFEVEARFAEAT